MIQTGPAVGVPLFRKVRTAFAQVVRFPVSRFQQMPRLGDCDRDQPGLNRQQPLAQIPLAEFTVERPGCKGG